MENGRLKTMNLARKRNVFHFNPLYGVLWGINIINVELKLGQAPSLHRSLRSPAASAMWMRVSVALHAMPKDRRGALLLYYILYIYICIYIYVYIYWYHWYLLTSDGKGCYLIMMTSSITRCSEDQLQLLPNVAYAAICSVSDTHLQAPRWQLDWQRCQSHPLQKVQSLPPLGWCGTSHQ